MLFIVYVNDLCDVIPSGITVKLFADDAKLYSVFSDSFTPDCLQSCLTAISDWSDHSSLATKIITYQMFCVARLSC